MARLLDTNLWIDLTRSRSPSAVRIFAAHQVDHPEACLAEPVIFEVLRNATDGEVAQLTPHFQLLPLLSSPDNIWNAGVALGRTCRLAGINAGSIDLLIAVVAIHHQAQLITFDTDFQQIATVSPLQVQLLQRPVV